MRWYAKLLRSWHGNISVFESFQYVHDKVFQTSTLTAWKRLNLHIISFRILFHTILFHTWYDMQICVSSRFAYHTVSHKKRNILAYYTISMPNTAWKVQAWNCYYSVFRISYYSHRFAVMRWYVNSEIEFLIKGDF